MTGSIPGMVDALLLRPDSTGEIIQVTPDGAREIQQAVGGFIEAILNVPGEWYMYANDSGAGDWNPTAATIVAVMCREHDIPLPLGVESLRGPVVIVGAEDGNPDSTDLAPHWLDFFREWGAQI